MATRFYLPASGSAPVTPPTPDSGWLVTTGFTAHGMPTAKSNTAKSVGTTRTKGSASANINQLDRQYLSNATLNAQTITGTFSLVLRGYESATALDGRVQVILRVVSGDGTTVRGTLYAGSTATVSATVGNEAEELPGTNAASRATRIKNALSVSSVSAQSGDRLLLEVGARLGSTSTTTQFTLEYGDPTAGADYALTSGLTTDLAPWLETSQTLAFTYDKTGGGAASAAGGGPDAVGRVETGGAVATGAGGGVKAVDRVKTGGAAAAAAGGGPEVVTHEFPKTGGAASSGAGSGAKAVQRTDTGGAAATGAGSGTKAVDRVDTGGAVSAAAGSGTKAVQRTETGGSVATCAGGGSKVVDRVDTGGGAATGAGSGTKAVQRTESGGAVAGAAGGGSKTVTIPGGLTKTGGAASGGAGSGAKTVLRVFTKTGGGAAAGVGGGAKTVTSFIVHTKTGGAAARGAAGGSRVVVPSEKLTVLSGGPPHINTPVIAGVPAVVVQVPAGAAATSTPVLASPPVVTPRVRS